MKQINTEHTIFKQTTPTYVSVSSDGKEMYSKIRTIVKREPVSITKYKSITTSCNKTISLSENHLIYVRRDHDDKFNAMYI